MADTEGEDVVDQFRRLTESRKALAILLVVGIVSGATFVGALIGINGVLPDRWRMYLFPIVFAAGYMIRPVYERAGNWLNDKLNGYLGPMTDHDTWVYSLDERGFGMNYSGGQMIVDWSAVGRVIRHHGSIAVYGPLGDMYLRDSVFADHGECDAVFDDIRKQVPDSTLVMDA